MDKPRPPVFGEIITPLFAPITVRIEYDDKHKDFTVRWACGKEFVRDDTDEVWKWIQTNIKGKPYTAKIGYPPHMAILTQKRARWYFCHEVPFAVDTELMTNETVGGGEETSNATAPASIGAGSKRKRGARVEDSQHSTWRGDCEKHLCAPVKA